MEDIKELIINDERVFIKKSKIFGWGIVKPYRIDGKINWKNLLIGGSWINFIRLVLIILLVAGCIYEYTSAVNVANECLNRSLQVIIP